MFTLVCGWKFKAEPLISFLHFIHIHSVRHFCVGRGGLVAVENGMDLGEMLYVIKLHHGHEIDRLGEKTTLVMRGKWRFMKFLILEGQIS